MPTAHKYIFFVFLAFFVFFFLGDISILELYFFGLPIYLACHIFWAVAQLILAFATFFRHAICLRKRHSNWPLPPPFAFWQGSSLQQQCPCFFSPSPDLGKQFWHCDELLPSLSELSLLC